MQNVLEGPTDEIPDSNANSVNYKSVINNLSEVIWSVDLSVEPYKIIYLNDPLARVPNGTFKRAPETIDEWQTFIHPDDQERIMDELVNAFNSGKGSYAYQVLRGDDTYRYVRDCVNVLYQDDKPMRMDVVTIDIDDVRRSRRNLELSQQRLKSIVDSLPDPVFISTQDSGKVIFANEVLFRVYGMKPSEFLGNKLIHFYQNFEGRRSYLDGLVKNGMVQNHELMLTNSKGESFWVSASTKPLDFQNEACYITILQDITVRKSLERELKQSNDRYQLAVEGTNDVIWEYDFKKRTSYLSPQFWDTMGLLTSENPLDENLLAKFIHEEDRMDFIQTIHDKFEAQEEELEMEARFLGANDRVIWVFIKAKILYRSGGDPKRIVGSLSNITSLKQAQSKLRESEFKYKLISEYSSDCICLQTPDGTFVFVSPACSEVLGYEAGELAELRMREFMEKDHLIRVSETMLEVIQRKKRTGSVTFKAKHKKGHDVWLETRGGLILDNEGEPQYLLTSTRDVTERIEAAQKLRESQERYKLITENSHDVVSLIDLSGKYDFVSPSVKETLGYEIDEMIGKVVIDFIHPDDMPELERHITDIVSNKKRDERLTFRFKNRDGNWRWVECQIGVILDDQNEVLYLRSNKRDVTDQIVTKQKLKEKEQQYKLVSENSGDVIALQDVNGVISFISPSCKGLLGYSPDNLLGTKFESLIHSSEKPFVKSVIDQTIKDQSKNIKVTYRIQSEELEYVWVESSYTAIVDPKGKFLYLQSSTRDISERIKALEKERQLSKLKSSFISMASHEFRTPLTTIQSSNELINMYLESDSDSNPKLKKHVGRIRTELERMNSLLKDVFTLGRLDVGKTKLKPEITSLAGIVKQVVLENSVQHQSRNVKIHIQGEERQVNLDSQLMSHAISNLVNNALKYSPDKRDPEVTIIYYKIGVRVEVRDFGIGIPEKDQKGLFESFSRASNVGDIEGTGLGLIIVKQFVEMHGGTVSFHSEVNQGTTFVIDLPEEN